ncbi:hypothetical protein ADIS_2744 [Lunatimonas lonarensis]|uniref:Uncharacterized protein n=1 Tax=Lunatimonas lonarensis TaxID=1232681 RepID=R7ZS49_9BACT|nr:hypothetical protein ADIS_2744 [Lunatimonas lonarensis]
MENQQQPVKHQKNSKPVEACPTHHYTPNKHTPYVLKNAPTNRENPADLARRHSRIG